MRCDHPRFASSRDRPSRGHPAVSEPTPGCGTFQYEREHVGPLDYRTHPSQDAEARRGLPLHAQGRDAAQGTEQHDRWRPRVHAERHPEPPARPAHHGEYFKRTRAGRDAGNGDGPACWFDRAVAYRPDDPTVRILYADELLKQGKRNEVLSQLQVAEEHASESATMHYNLGLLYLDLKDFDRSVEHARQGLRAGSAASRAEEQARTSGQVARLSAPRPTSTRMPAPVARLCVVRSPLCDPDDARVLAACARAGLVVAMR